MAQSDFSKAFAAARKEKGAGKTFTFKGKSYTTNYASDAVKAPTTRPKAQPAERATTPKTSPMPRARPASLSHNTKNDVSPSTTESAPKTSPRPKARGAAPTTSPRPKARSAAPRTSTRPTARPSFPTYAEWRKDNKGGLRGYTMAKSRANNK